MNFLHKIFSREKGIPTAMTDSNTDLDAASSSKVDTAPLSTRKVPSEASGLDLPPGLHVGNKSDVGQHREQNEDAFYTFNSFIQSIDGTEPFGLFIVADGMGGYKGGEKASSIAIRAAANHILKHIYLPYLSRNSHHSGGAPINEVLTSAVIAANNIVIDTVPEAGTTLTVAVVMGHQAYLAHVGDSRAYIYHNSDLRQITHDHSLVARMVELGQVTAEEALTHQHRNVLYRAIGQTNSLEVETYLQSFPPNSYLLICSDGLWGLIPDEEIKEVLVSASAPHDGVERLIDLANQKGGDDNITAILVGIGS